MLRLNFTPFPVLETERSILRQLTKTDAAQVFTMRNDAVITKYTGGPKAKVLADAEDFIERINSYVINNESILWGITLKGEEHLAGSICIWNIVTDEDSAELGYVLLPAHQGKGLMDEALKAVIAYGVEVMGIKLLEAYTHEENDPSIRLLLRNGFKPHEKMEEIRAGADDLRTMLIYQLPCG